MYASSDIEEDGWCGEGHHFLHGIIGVYGLGFFRSVWTWFLRVNRLNNEKWCYFIGACAAKIFIISRIDSFCL